jgi:hypothetical protein
MKNTFRFETLTEAVHFFMKEFAMSNQQATHFIWDHSFRMGTDRAVWITEPN